MIIKSTTPDGTRYEIELTKTGPREGTVRIKSWKPGKKGGPSTDDTTKLYDVKAKKDGDIVKVQCFARVFGPDPVVQFRLGIDLLSVTISGALANNGVTRHAVSPPDLTALREYVQACKFPVLS